MSKEVQTFSSYLAKNKDVILTQIQMALPKHLNAEKMLRVVMTELRRVPDLNKCTIQSLLGGIIQASQLGLEPGNALGHCYLIPYRNNKNQTYECQFIIGYRGMIDLARRSGQMISISAHVVHQNDDFDFEYGLNERLSHKPTKGERGNFVCAYAYAKLANTYDNSGVGAYQFEVMFKDEINDIRTRSKSGSSGYSPWSTDYEEMAKKTVIRRLFKYLPISTEMLKAINIDEAYERGEAILPDDLIEVEGTEVIPAAPTKADAIANKINPAKADDKTADFIKAME